MIDVEALVAFLEAQIAEDGRIALAAIADDGGQDGGFEDALWLTHPTFANPRFADAAADMIRAFAVPRRILADVEAKRQIIARFQDALARTSDFDHSTAVAELQVREYEDFVLPALLAAYVDRPGFDPTWLAEEAPDGRR